MSTLEQLEFLISHSAYGDLSEVPHPIIVSKFCSPTAATIAYSYY